MAAVYMLKGTCGRHYIGSTSNLDQRLEAHRRGNTATTRRLGHPLTLLVFKGFKTIEEARQIERMSIAWKNPAKARAYLET